MLDLTSFDAALKEYYTEEAVEDMVYKDNPLYALLPKDEKFFGTSREIPIIYGNPQGRSRDFTRAQTRAAATASYIARFSVTRVHDYQLAQIDNETLLASGSDKGAFMDAATLEFDGAIHNLKRTLAVDVFRKGYGARGIVGSVSTTTITLSDVNDIVNFEVGMELVVSTSEDAAALRALAGSNGLIITAINRVTGVITCGAANITTTIPSTTTGDYLFVRGDREDSATPARFKIAGLEAWCPYTAPGSTSFFGVDRSVDVTRLGGLRYDGSAEPIEEALTSAASFAAREGAGIDHYIMNYANYNSLEKALGSKVQYVDLMANARVGFRGIRINGPKGEINIVPDQNCPADRVWGLTLSTWKLGSIGKAVRVIDTDGNQMLRLNASDGVESRWGFYGNMWCKAPGQNIAVKIA